MDSISIQGGEIVLFPTCYKESKTFFPKRPAKTKKKIPMFFWGAQGSLKDPDWLKNLQAIMEVENNPVRRCMFSFPKPFHVPL